LFQGFVVGIKRIHATPESSSSYRIYPTNKPTIQKTKQTFKMATITPEYGYVSKKFKIPGIQSNPFT
jgi:hypothetical protein